MHYRTIADISSAATLPPYADRRPAGFTEGVPTVARPWVSEVRRRKTLTIFCAPNASSWSATLATAITRFNALSNALSLGITYVAFRRPPDRNDLTGADVQFSTASGRFTFAGLGTSGSGSLNADASAGATRKLSFENGGTGKAFIFVPANMTGFVGLGVTFHEMVHAAGLDDSDHSSFRDPDIFCSVLSVSGDRLLAGSRTMPPIYMTRRTAAKIQALW
jgi:hypothetical protein